MSALVNDANPPAPVQPTSAEPTKNTVKAEVQQVRRSSKSSSNKSSVVDDSVVVKCAMVGDVQVGKTTLMVKYVEGRLDQDYIQTLGVVPLEKKIILRNTEVTFSVWDLGGQREFLSMLPLVCNEAAAIFFMFDLSNKASLRSVKEWYRQARGLNRSAAAFLVGTKFDQFILLPKEKQAEIDRQARKYAKAMKASIVFTSSTHSVNVQNLFKVVLAKVFDLRSTLTKIDTVGDPLLMFN